MTHTGWRIENGRLKEGTATLADMRYERCWDEARFLIAAAPDLYEACKWAESLISGCEWGSTLTRQEEDQLTKLQAAIAKAEGR